MSSNGASARSDGFQVPASARDAEKAVDPAKDPADKIASEGLDIEHVYVDDDPRKWSNMRKVGYSCTTIYRATGSVLYYCPSPHSVDERVVLDLLCNDDCRPQREHIQP
jgi:hypothetical protein